MRVCVFSDIHGNGPAFRAAYPVICEVGADRNIFLGDLCGYYFDQLEIFRTLKKTPNLVAIRGNHDQMFLDMLDGNEYLRRDYLKRYGSSMENLLASDYGELAEWLSVLPLAVENLDEEMTCVHGSPENNLEGYVYPDTAIDSLAIAGKYLLAGHTHYKMHRSLKNAHIINPGSLGQPRDGSWPSFAVIETSLSTVHFAQVQYDKGEVKKQLTSRNEKNRYLGEILHRIRE